MKLESWFNMLALREDVPQFPQPSQLTEVILSVYKDYQLDLPDDLYSPLTDNTPLNRSSSVMSKRSVENEVPLEERDGTSVQGTGFFVGVGSNPIACSTETEA